MCASQVFCVVDHTMSVFIVQRSCSVNSGHSVITDVKMGIKPCFGAKLLQPFYCTATQPAQYLLRHLQSNLGWQAQMAPLIQVNYL